MFNKNLVLKVTSLLAVGLMLASAAGISYAAGPKESENTKDRDNLVSSAVFGNGNMGALALPAAGMGSIELINYDGGSSQLTVDFNGIDYVLPPSAQGGSGVWNHVEFSLAPGTYNYTASVTGNETILNNTITVWAGKVTSIGFYDNPEITRGKDESDDSKEVKSATSETSSKDTERQSKADTDDLLFGVSDVTGQAH